VEEALKKPEVVINIIMAEGTELPRKWDYGTPPVTVVPSDIFKSLTETEAPQGVLAVCRQETREAEEDKLETFLLIDAVQDPGNLGTMIRTADAAGIDAVIVAMDRTLDYRKINTAYQALRRGAYSPTRRCW